MSRPYAVVELTVTVTVELPPGQEYNGQACDDPAIEATLQAVAGGPIDVYLWGEGEAPARVTVEAYEDDATVEEDGR